MSQGTARKLVSGQVQMPGTGAMPAPTQRPPAFSDQVSSLSGMFLPRFALKFAVASIEVPGTRPTLAGNQHAAYGLGSVRIADIGECAWVGYQLAMLPPDYLGNAYNRDGWTGATILGWGDVEGNQALILMGPNLVRRGVRVGAWTALPLDYALLFADDPTLGVTTFQPNPDTLAYIPFPNWACNAFSGGDPVTEPVLPTRREPIVNDAPMNVRLTQNDTMDVALIIGQQSYNNWAAPGGTIALSVGGEIKLADMTQQVPYAR